MIGHRACFVPIISLHEGCPCGEIGCINFYFECVMTVHFWTIIFLSFPSMHYEHPPLTPCNSLELDLLSDTKTRTRHLVDHAPPLIMTVRLGLLFSFPPLLLLYYGHSSFAPCNGLELDLLSDTKTGTRCLMDCAPPPLSITCLTLALTVLPMCASVPADVHPLRPLCTHISLLLPYVSLHLLCTPS